MAGMLIYKIYKKEKARIFPSRVFLLIYIEILLQTAFFSREPGSRKQIDLHLFGTWGQTAMHNFMGYVSGEHFDLALVECDSYALKRSQNVLHAAEIIDVLNKYIPTIAYGNYCYIMKRNFGNARHTIVDNVINNIIDCINQYEEHNIVPHVKEYDEIPFIDRDMLLKISYYRKNKRNTLLQTAKGCENTCIFCQRKGWQSKFNEKCAGE